MMYRFTAAARSEPGEAAEYYESRRDGLGTEFAIEMGIGLARVLEAPDRWTEITPGFRKYRLDRFPYAIIYRILSSALFEVVSIFDQRRQPGSWSPT